jgi:hypothetical protein
MADRPGLFDSAWLKWAWAVADVEILKRQLEAFAVDPDAQALRTTAIKYQPHRHCFVVSVATLPPLPARHSLLLGNIVHNLRGCLDHLAWALAERGRTPPSFGALTPAQRGAIAFPISKNRTEFVRALKATSRWPSCLPGVRRDDIAPIRASQPYVHGKRLIPFHVLTVLSGFLDEDKHRAIQPLAFLPTAPPVYEILDVTDCTITRPILEPANLPLKVNAELARVYIRKTGPNPHLEMEVHGAVEPALGATMPLRAWLEDAPNDIGLLLAVYADVPEEARRLSPFVSRRVRALIENG